MGGPFLGGGVALCEIHDSNPTIEKTGIFYYRLEGRGFLI
jgi:hypothetical protein